jgi:hypothetical protein
LSFSALPLYFLPILPLISPQNAFFLKKNEKKLAKNLVEPENSSTFATA